MMMMLPRGEGGPGGDGVGWEGVSWAGRRAWDPGGQRQRCRQQWEKGSRSRPAIPPRRGRARSTGPADNAPGRSGNAWGRGSAVPALPRVATPDPQVLPEPPHWHGMLLGSSVPEGSNTVPWGGKQAVRPGKAPGTGHHPCRFQGTTPASEHPLASEHPPAEPDAAAARRSSTRCKGLSRTGPERVAAPAP